MRFLTLNVMRGLLVTLLFLFYPLIVYLLLVNDQPWMGSTLVLGILIWKIRNRPDRLWWWAGIALLSFLIIQVSGPDVISKLSPILIHSGLLYLFWNSLKTTPLIEQFARLDFPELPPEIVVYTRQLTMLWALFFALNIVACVLMALWGSDSLWALYNGLIVYGLIGVLLVGEYVWRHIQFPDLEIPPIRKTAQNIMESGRKIWG